MRLENKLGLVILGGVVLGTAAAFAGIKYINLKLYHEKPRVEHTPVLENYRPVK